jgi:hypothetical protein
VVRKNGRVRISHRTTLDPLREHIVDDRFGSRPHDERLFEFLAAAVGDHRDLGCEALDVLRLLLQEALRNKEREISVACAGLLDAAVEFVAQRLPDRESVGAEHDTSAHRRVVGELGARDYLVVPGGEVHASRGDFLFVLLVGHAMISNREEYTPAPGKAQAALPFIAGSSTIAQWRL